MPDEKKLCPMKCGLLVEVPLNGENTNDNYWKCDGERCAWWVIDRCAIPQIALNEKYKKEKGEQQ